MDINVKIERHTKIGLFAAMVCLICVTALEAKKSHSIPIYEQLSQWQFTRKAIPVPAEGIRFKRDNASWSLDRGKLWLMKPTPDGRVTGLIFEGEGRFKMMVPHWVEREQLQRCSGKKDYLKESNEIDEPISKLLIRTPEPIIEKLISALGKTSAAATSYSTHSLAANRHKISIKLAKDNIDARICAGLFNGEDEYLRVVMKTGTFGWLTYIFDKYEKEEIQLRKFRKKYEFVETWVSLDRDSQRLSSGQPGSLHPSYIDILSQDIHADLTRIKLAFKGFWQMGQTEKARFTAQVSFRPLQENLRMIQFSLHPLARIREVMDGEGNHIPYVGKYIKRTHVSDFWVLLNKPCKKGKTEKIAVVYELGIQNFVSGGLWYPAWKDVIDKHTVHLRARMNKGLNIRAVGENLDEFVSGKYKISEWRSRGPVAIYGFTIARKFREKRVAIRNMPEVISFCGDNAPTTNNMVKNVAIDVANSLNFYSTIFKARLPYKNIWVTAIESGHGQAFPGFLHLSQFTYSAEHPGASELFRAHETAHFFWGHWVGWKSYRDQWLSEAFAEYSAMLYVQASMPKKKHFANILAAYRNELMGSVKVLFSKYVRPMRELMFKRNRERVGPIGVGFRSSVSDAPFGYQMQTYHKGPLVLHMIRMMMRNSVGNNQLFITILKDFLHTYKGKNASTEDFRRVIEKHTRQDWSWFFNQWVHGTAIPIYKWNYRASKKDKATGKYKVVVNVTQNNVPEGFKMPVPLQVVFKGGSVRHFSLPIAKKEQTFNFTFDKKIKKVIFNPGQAVLSLNK